MKSIIIKIKWNIAKLINRYNPITFTKIIKGLVKDVKELNNRLDEHDGLINESDINSQVDINTDNIENNKIGIEDLEDNLANIEMDYINEDQLHEKFYDFKQENLINDDLHELKKKVNKIDDDLNDIYQDNLINDDYNNRMDFEERVFGYTIEPRVHKSIETATIKHLKEVLNNNKKHNELMEKLLNELCELNKIKEGNKDD